MAGALLVAPSRTDDPADPSVKPQTKAAAGDVAIPACLEKLTLTRQKQKQIKQIVRDYDSDLASVWKQFGVSCLETVRTEALLLTAIEDNLTDAQRKQVRDQRRRTAQHQKSLAGTDDKPNRATSKPVGAVEQEIGIGGVSLTAEQEAAADKLQEKCPRILRAQPHPLRQGSARGQVRPQRVGFLALLCFSYFSRNKP